MERYNEIKQTFDNHYRYYLERQTARQNIGLMELKYEHSYRVADFAAKIAEEEKLNPTWLELSAITGLLHDIGRFEQVDRYGTLDDLISVDHGNFGEEVLQRTGFLNRLGPEEQIAVLFAVRVHNKRAINQFPDSLSECLAKIVRDADKLDVFRVMHHNMLNGSETQKRAVFLNLTPSNKISPDVLLSIKQRMLVNKELVKTTTDFKLMQLSWIFDFNYRASRAIVRGSEHYRFLLEDFSKSVEQKEIVDIFEQYLSSFTL